MEPLVIDHGKKNLLGIGINAVDYEAAVQTIIEAAKAKRPFGVSAMAVHGVMTDVLDRQHCYRLNQLEMIVPDGQPVRWGLNLIHGLKLPDRVYGPNLTLKVCEAAAQEDLPIFMFGGKSETLDKLEHRLRELYPEIRVTGKCPSKFRTLESGERDELIQKIVESGAAITLVGIGCPRQEVWAFEFRERLSMPVMAVGAAFAFHAGELAQAPAWMQDRGLEWLYRLTREPTRLWRRYVLLNPAYVSLLALQLIRLLTLHPSRGVQPTEEILYG
jgi:N-acetylglucosaminyldiphosphoundecaprenol N-acetyl-beta-D-mannosaminyltransferase